MNAWADNLHTEAKAWDGWFSNPDRATVRAQRLALVHGACPLLKEIKPSPGETVRIIDVGSGPIGTIGQRSLNNPVEVVYADALADEYNAILDKHAVNAPRITKIKGEDLISQFGWRSFHVVNCANALDHFDNPRKAFINMWAICKPGGLLSIVSFENEGLREKWGGLHQWNLRADDDGLWLGDKTGKEINLLLCVCDVEYSWRYKARDPNVFEVMLRRH